MIYQILKSFNMDTSIDFNIELMEKKSITSIFNPEIDVRIG